MSESPLVIKLSDLLAEVIQICADERVDHREVARGLLQFANGLGRLPTIDADVAITVNDTGGRLSVEVSLQP